MRPPRIALLVSLLAAPPAGLLLPLPISLNSSLALAQTLQPGKAEANRLLQQGIEQFRRNQYQKAIES